MANFDWITGKCSFSIENSALSHMDDCTVDYIEYTDEMVTIYWETGGTTEIKYEKINFYNHEGDVTGVILTRNNTIIRITTRCE